MKKASKFVSLFLVASLVLSSCSGTKTPAPTTSPSASTEVATASTNDNILRIALEQDIETLDSQQNTADYTAAVADGITEGLLREHNGTYSPGMAESYKTDDYKTWTFTIRENAAWSDGTPITAQDFEYSYKTIFTRPEASKVTVFFEGLKNYGAVTAAIKEGKTGDELKAIIDTLGVKAVDDRTLVVELESPRPWYMTNFSSTYFGPIKKELFEANGAKYGSSKDLMAYNGPFMVQDWKYNQSVTLVKNPNYWNKDAIALDGVELQIVKDVEPRVNLFREGRVDIATASSEYYQTMKDQVFAGEGTGWRYILTNQNRVNADKQLVNKAVSDLLANRDFVDAISYAIDRTVLFSQVVQDPTYFPAAYVVPAKTSLNNNANETFEEGRARLGLTSNVSLTAEPEKAKESLKKAMDALGYKDVSQLPAISLVCATGTDNVTICDFIRLTCEETLGLKITVEPVEFSVRDSRIISGDYDLLIMGWGLDYDDATSIYQVWSSDLFATGWAEGHPDQHANFVKTMEELGTMTDFAARGDKLLAAETYLLENGPFITLNFSGAAMLKNSRVQNLEIRRMGARLDYTSVKVQ